MDWRQPYKCVFTAVHHNLLETLSCHIPVLVMGDSLCWIRRICCSTSTGGCQNFSCNRAFSECNVAYLSCGSVFHVEKSTNVSARVQTYVSNSCNWHCTRLWKALNFCTVYCGPMRQYSKETVYTIYITCVCGEQRIFMPLLTLQYSKDLVPVFGLES
jgi:hypothetical protein